MSRASKDFQKELKQLLEKYNAVITFTHMGDNLSIDNPYMEITANIQDKDYTLVSKYGFTIKPSDLPSIDPEEFMVMGVNDWPEDGQKDFEITFVKDGESFPNAIHRAKEYYDNDVDCYIVDRVGNIVHQ